MKRSLTWAKPAISKWGREEAMSIMIVDDSVDDRVLLQRTLEGAGYKELVQAGSGAEALKLLSGSPPGKGTEVDLILLDIVMPGMDGIEACKNIKAIEPLRDVLVIMVTVKSETAELERAFTAGAMDYITKPLDKVELLVRVRSALALKREMDCRKARELELAKRTEELEHALREVKTLRGFIPICASCKKVRNDQGYWQGVERYLRDHSEAEFTHDICPDCIQKLYPGLAKS